MALSLARGLIEKNGLVHKLNLLRDDHLQVLLSLSSPRDEQCMQSPQIGAEHPAVFCIE